MKYSVIIPLYNKAPYIRKALESVLAQTYIDYEVIVVDDGSTDGSAEIAESFLQDPASRLSPFASRLRLLKQPNQGVSAARNNGVAQAHGDYLAFLDADDWWEPTYLERMAQLITDYPDAGLYACNYYYHKDGVNIIKVDIPTGYFNYPKEYFKNFAMPITSISVVIPSKVYDEMGGFPIGVKLGEDFLLWAKIAVQYPVAFLNEPLAYYNNTLLPNYRATYHLHKPEEHMLFRLELAFGDEVKGMGNEVNVESLKFKGTESSEANIPASNLSPLTSNLKSDWKSLLDMLRLLGLHSYWLNDEYHEIAQQEIDKVDMSKQYEFLVKLYRTPRWIQKFKHRIVRIVAPIKHQLKQMPSKKNDNVNIIVYNKQYRESLFGNK